MLSNLKYKFRWLGIINSPFKLPNISFYFGKINRGVPYFLPRKWIKSEKKGYQNPVSLKYGIQIVGHGWKTKFDQYRHEYSPMVSIVGFNRQFCIYFGLNGKERLKNDCYWEAYLYYKYRTDKSKDKVRRLKQVFEQYSASWGNKNEGYTNYYYFILRNKYLKHVA